MVCDLLRDLEDFRRIAYELCEELAAQGIRYAEAIFSPAQHARRLDDWFGPIEAVLDGLAAGERDAGVVVRLEPDFIRDYGEDEARRRPCGDHPSRHRRLGGGGRRAKRCYGEPTEIVTDSM